MATFSKDLLALADQISRNGKIPHVANTADAAALVLTHILMSVLGGDNQSPLSDEMSGSDVAVSAIFLCAVGVPLMGFLEHEGVELPINSVIARSARATFQFMEPRAAADAIVYGIEKYKTVIAEGVGRNNVERYFETLSEAVFLYVTTRDEKWQKAFQSLYGTLRNARE